jgi:site-specific DNA-cytosine methylase
MYTAIDFFAGSGLVELGLEPEFETLWANDNCAKKQEIYEANHPGGNFHLGYLRSGGNLHRGDTARRSG